MDFRSMKCRANYIGRAAGTFSQQRVFDTVTGPSLNWIPKERRATMIPRRRLAVLACALFPVAAVADDYLGGLRLPRPGVTTPAGVFSFESEPLTTAFNTSAALRAVDSGYRFKLGYKYSRYFSVESEFVDFGRTPADIFTSPGNLASAFRSTGFGIDAVATLPVW